MTHYFFDPKTNTLHGPLDRMPPGKHAVNHNEKCLCDVCIRDIAISKAFNDYLQTLPSIPHTLTGPSRVVPEGEIEWRYEYRDFETSDWKECTHRTWWKIDDDKFRRAVATPITEEGKAIPAHIVDDMKLDSYYDGFKDGANLTGEPTTQAPGYTSTSGDECNCGQYVGHYQPECPVHGKLIGHIVDDFKNKKETFIPATQPHSPAQPDQEAAEKQDAHWIYKHWCGIWERAHSLNMSDFQKTMREEYSLSGQQPVDAVDELQSLSNAPYCSEPNASIDYKEGYNDAIDLVREAARNALFSGSQASNQSGGPQTKK